MAPGRIRVFIAGTIYPKRSLVRRFLQDDGYEIVGETLSRQSLVATIRTSEPDAVVIDEQLLAGGRGGTMARIRGAAPDAKIIVFTSSPGSAPAGADGYLEKGIALSALTALLMRLFAEAPRVEPSPAGAAAAAGGGAAEVAAASVAASTETARPRTPVYAGTPGGAPTGVSAALGRFVTIAGGAILMAWGLIAMISTGGVPPAPVDRTDTNGEGTIVSPPTEESSLDDAHATLRRLVDALEAGNYVLASVDAQILMDERRQATAEGFSLSGLDAQIVARLEGIVTELPLRVNATLSDILGALYPTLPEEEQPGGGSGVVLGPTTGTFTGGATQQTPGGNGGGTDGTDGTDGTGGTGGTGGTAGTGGTGGTGGTEGEAGGPVSLGPGDGRAWGQSHRPEHAAGGSEHGGGPPPWANGNAFGHDKANGRALGHDK